MIVYNLICDSDHRFEGWFRSSGDFDDQSTRGLLCCPHCASAHVIKAPSAPAIPAKGNSKQGERKRAESVLHKLAEIREEQSTNPANARDSGKTDQGNGISDRASSDRGNAGMANFDQSNSDRGSAGQGTDRQGKDGSGSAGQGDFGQGDFGQAKANRTLSEREQFHREQSERRAGLAGAPSGNNRADQGGANGDPNNRAPSHAQGNFPSANVPPGENGFAGGHLTPQLAEAMQKLAKAQAEALKNSTNVGKDFAEKSRAMHYGEQDAEPIHGEASAEEAKDLMEEGIAISPLLFPTASSKDVN